VDWARRRQFVIAYIGIAARYENHLNWHARDAHLQRQSRFDIETIAHDLKSRQIRIETTFRQLQPRSRTPMIRVNAPRCLKLGTSQFPVACFDEAFSFPHVRFELLQPVVFRKPHRLQLFILIGIE
jgi:hypothetical protein